MSVSPPTSQWKPSSLQPLSTEPDSKVNGYPGNDAESYESSSDTVVEQPQRSGGIDEGGDMEEEEEGAVLVKEEVIAIRPKTARGYHVDNMQERYERYSNSKVRDVALNSETTLKFRMFIL